MKTDTNITKEIVKGFDLTIYLNLQVYKEVAKKGDRILLEGKGYVNGIYSIESKKDVLTVCYVSDNVSFKEYRGKNSYHTKELNQRVALLKESDYKKLKSTYF